jgi:hypothetical protein
VALAKPVTKIRVMPRVIKKTKKGFSEDTMERAIDRPKKVEWETAVPMKAYLFATISGDTIPHATDTKMHPSNALSRKSY